MMPAAMGDPLPPTEPLRKSRLDDLLGRDTADRIAGVDLRYSRIVKRLRLILPVLAAILVVVVFLLSGPDELTKPVDVDKVLPQEAGKNELVTPRFESQDGDAQPYSVTATRAYQKSDDLKVIELEKPVADMTLKDNTWLALQSENGEYNQDNQKIHLQGNVRLFHDEGYELITDAVDIDIKNQTAVTDQPVRGHGPVGRIKASGFEAMGSADRLRFKGPAKLTIYSSDEASLLDEAAPSAAPNPNPPPSETP